VVASTLIPRASASLLALATLLVLVPASPAAASCPTHLHILSYVGETVGVNPDGGACAAFPENAAGSHAQVVLPGATAIEVYLETPAENATSLPLSLHGLGFGPDARSLTLHSLENGTARYWSGHLPIPDGVLARGSLSASTTLTDGTVLAVTCQKPA
jgi:hypothetical protein